MKKAGLPLLLLLAVASPHAGACLAGGVPEGFRLVESSSATVNGEVVFLSAVLREACFRRCGAYEGLPAESPTLSAARDRIVSDTLVLQEQKKLGLGQVDNAALARMEEDVRKALSACADPCARGVGPGEAAEFARRRLLVRDFLMKRVYVFVDVSEDDVRREVEAARARRGPGDPEVLEADVRSRLVEARAGQEIRNWFARTTSKSKIFLSPMEER